MTLRFATKEGTQNYAKRFSHFAKDFYRNARGLTISSIGLGTYLGAANHKTDALYLSAIKEAIRSGINVIDTAINYRCMRSEIIIGTALQELEKEGFSREEIVIATKGGYIPFEQEPPPNPEAYFQKTYLDTKILQKEDLAAGCHAISTTYLKDQITRSLRNLKTGIDIYYIHNPETQLDKLDREEFYQKIRQAFSLLEQEVQEKKLQYYGIATWNGFRVPPETTEHIGIEKIQSLAKEVGGESHHFAVLQLPYNLQLTEAHIAPTQPYQDAKLSPLAISNKFGIVVMTSVPTMQGRLSRNLPQNVSDTLGLESHAQRAIQFARATPGVKSVLIGMKQPAHVKENLKVAEVLARKELIENLFSLSES